MIMMGVVILMMVVMMVVMMMMLMMMVLMMMMMVVMLIKRQWHAAEDIGIYNRGFVLKIILHFKVKQKIARKLLKSPQL